MKNERVPEKFSMPSRPCARGGVRKGSRKILEQKFSGKRRNRRTRLTGEHLQPVARQSRFDDVILSVAARRSRKISILLVCCFFNKKESPQKHKDSSFRSATFRMTLRPPLVTSLAAGELHSEGTSLRQAYFTRL